MTYQVVVWGTGNVGRPAIRAIATHRDLELVGVVVSNPAKVGKDAGELAGIAPLGVLATDDTEIAFAPDVDCVVYAATADTRPMEAYMDLERLLRSGRNVVSTAFYPLLHPASAPPELMGMLTPAMEAGNSSVFVSGIDPGWALDILPALVSGVGAGITEIRIQEIFNYALYDAPDIVRNVIGLGGPMNVMPQMLEEMSLMTVWAPMVRVLADSLEVEIDEVTTQWNAVHLSGRSKSRGWEPSKKEPWAHFASKSQDSQEGTHSLRWSTSPESTMTVRPIGNSL